LAPGHGDGAELDGPQTEALGQVVVVQGLGAPVALVTAGRNPELGRHGMELTGVVRQEMRPPVLALADDRPLAPVVDVDGQRPVHGRGRRTSAGWAHQRPLKRQDSPLRTSG
jgi:hypothetical protein